MNSLNTTVHSPKSANEMASERTELATGRTMMASDRSLMAWVRTGLSMISFGFTIYKLLDGLQQRGTPLAGVNSPRAVGLFLTGLGTAAIVMGTLEYFDRTRSLLMYGAIRVWRPAFIMAIVMSLTGVFLFAGIISKLL